MAPTPRKNFSPTRNCNRFATPARPGFGTDCPYGGGSISRLSIRRRVGSDYESEGGFVCSLIVLIRFMTADVVIPPAGAMPGDARQAAKSHT